MVGEGGEVPFAIEAAFQAWGKYQPPVHPLRGVLKSFGSCVVP